MPDEVLPAAGREDARPPASRRGRIALALGLALAAAAVYAPAIHGGWAWDDVDLVVPSPALRDLAGLRQAVSTDLFRQANPRVEQTPYWRPLALASFWLESRLGRAPRALHVGNLVLYAAAVALLALALLRRLGPGAGLWAPALATAWWALHPEHVEVIAWISGRYDLLAGVAGLLLVAVPWRPGAARALVHGAALLAGLLSKDGFAVMAAVVLADDWAERRSPAAAAPRWVAMGGAILAWLGLRAALGLPSLRSVEAPGLSQIPGLVLETIGTYALRAIAPLPLTPWHPRTGSAAVMAAGAAVLAGLAIAVALRRRLAVPAVLFVAGLAPVAMAIDQTGVTSERYFFVPSIGLALLVADGLAACARVERMGVRRLAFGAAALLAVLGLPPVRARIPEWRDDRALFTAALRVNADDPWANTHLGVAAARRGALKEAREALERAERSDPTNGRVLSAHAWVLLQAHDFAGALAQAQRATVMAPGDPSGWLFLSAARHLEGDHRGELAAALRALQLSPGFPEAAERRAIAVCEVSGGTDCERGRAPEPGPGPARP